jgi:ACS family hexuronate transporter-like MFS transporter
LKRILFNFRWWVVGLLLIATILNYVDRQSFSILATTIQGAFGMSDIAYGHIVSAFLLSYTVAYVIAGPFCDKLGVRAGMTIAIAFWSIAELIPAFAHTVLMLGLARLLLGLGEASVWVIGPKAVSELFVPEERALAIGIYTAGATLGATIAPPLIAFLSKGYGWRSVFVVTGFAGLLWIIPWLMLYRRNLASSLLPVTKAPIPWRGILQSRNLWLLLFARMLTDPVWYFYLFWYPKYLNDSRHLSLGQVGRTVWIVYLAADLGAILGGWVSGRFIRAGMVPLRARRLVMTIAALFLPLSPLVYLLPSLSAGLLIAGILTFAHMAWMITMAAALVDLFPGDQVATAFGFVAAGSGLGGLLSTEIIAHGIAKTGFFPVFLAMGCLHPIALLLIRKLRSGESTSIDAAEVYA